MRELKAASMPKQDSMAPWRLLALGVFAAAAASLTLPAQAQGHHGSGTPGMMMFGGSPERVARAVDHLLDGLNATDAQRTQIKQIATAAAADMKAQREAGRGLHERGLQLFTAPVVDANAAEALRQQMAAQHEQTSKRTLQAMIDVSRVLTPEQRARLGERMKERQAMQKDRMQRMQDHHPQRPQPGQQPPAPK